MGRFAVCLFCLGLSLGCEKKSPNPEKVAVPVAAMKIVAATIPANFEYVGVAESSHIVEIRARVEGYLEQIDYSEGALVDVNKLLFVIDQRPFVDALNIAKGDLERAKALHWNSVQSLDRMAPLYKQNAVSQRDYDNAVAEEWSQRGNMMSAQANVEKAELNLSFCSITAPVKGWVSKAIFREGALISPGPDSLMTNLFVLDPIWVNFSVSDGDILKARNDVAKKNLELPKDMNFSIEVRMADGTSFPADAKIDFSAPDIQQSTGTMLVRSIVANPNAWLRPGQFVSVLLKGATRPNAIIVPQTAVAQGKNGTFVYVINSEGLAQIRIVEPGDWYHDYWVILSGLKDGELIVADGVNRVQNNTPVRIKSLIPSAPQKVDGADMPSLGL